MKIDYRSDTVTLPTDAMKEAMFKAPLGDDVYGEDPTVNQLEAFAANLLGKEAALFAPSGTQTNLLALMAHCERGDEYIVGQDAHTFKYEGGGAAVLGSIQPQPLDFAPNGVIPIDAIERAIKPDDSHFAKTRLICLENTHHGQVLPLPYLSEVQTLADKHQLKMHLDGARLFNAVVASGETPSKLVAPFDSVSICLSKGLGAPVGSLLVGSQDVVDKARRWRKVLGGGMRQAGLLAAAGLYALKHHVDRLADDHRRAKTLTEALRAIDEIEVLPHSGITNMVFVKLPTNSIDRLHNAAQQANMVLPTGSTLRLVTHLNIDDAMIDQTIDVFRSVYS